ncbi:spindle and kinetochore-associated protein 2-like isoform X1 [Sinocyclocheilus anshuiensis]|uniref:spindle and kinetochore-associated protein 2-like isoform X1 n=2 Tax=Sinocyclocheilus anshuiensis TaxID=1608454 RepID=UPI0007B7B96C|nr:PREDICTED: spindle and kinetochore-associated protein 2-like isoform X1 [Sinocyclocheilus anshuiensis]XP_016338494.1 PREDICTED: spindle and kinetochore-associated protein 2-like isoform X1 [Sinocyclocheilus anshuiensis]
METVDKLEAMFQKAEADIEYVEKRLKFDFMANVREAGTFEGNPVQLLENLSAIKARHAALCTQVEEITAEQKRSMDSIRAHLDTTVQLVQQLQNTADVQVPPLTKEEQEARDFFCSSIATLNVEAAYTEEPQTQAQTESQNMCDEVSEGTFETVPRSVRGNLKLNDLNTLYKQLSEYFSDKDRGPISTQRMKLNMKVSDSALKTLQHLKIIELDKKGLVSLLAKDGEETGTK